MKNKCFIVCFFVFFQLWPQFYNGYDLIFGRSRTQYTQKYIWSQWRTSHFDVLFYQGERSLAQYVIQVAYQEIKDISFFLDYLPEKKFFFIIFSNKNDYFSSNVGYSSHESINTGGKTQIVSNKIALFFNGNHEDLRRQIKEGIARSLIFQFLFGDDPNMNVRRSQSLFVPRWFIEGLVSYIVNGWNMDLDFRLKNLLHRKKYFSINQFKEEESSLMGHAFWNFLLTTYGKNTISKVLTFLVVSRSYTTALLYVYGKNFRQLLNDCMSFYKTRWKEEKNELPVSQKVLAFKPKFHVYQHHLSPDGKKLLFVTDKWDKKKIWLMDLDSRKKEKIFNTGKKWVLNQDYSYPVLAWHPTSRIVAWINEEKQKRYLYLYDLVEKSYEKINIEQFQKVLDISFSSTGTTLVMTALLDGQVDLFLFYLGSNAIKRLTNDQYDERYAMFSPDDRWICYASNKPIVLDSFSNQLQMQNYDLFLLNPASKLMYRITTTQDTNEILPNWNGNEILYFFNDEYGFQNIFSARLDSAILFVDTVFHYRYFFVQKPVSRWNYPVLEWTFKMPQHLFLIQTPKNKEQRIISHQQIKSFLETPSHDVYSKRFGESSNKSHIQEPSYQKEKISPFNSDSSQASDTNKVNIYDFKFKTLAKNVKPSDNSPSFNNLSTYKDTFIVSRIQNYNVEYSLNRVTTQIASDYLGQGYLPFSPAYLDVQLPQTNGFIKFVASDLLEDYRIIGGVKIKPSLKGNEYLLAYENFKKRWDYHFSFLYYNYFFRSEEQGVERHQVSHFSVGSSYPFYNLLTFRSFFMLRYDNVVKLGYDDASLLDTAKKVYWGSLRSELVYDNTIQEMPNVLVGWRWKIFSEYYQGIHNKLLNLVTFGVDFRTYLRIHKTMILAHRFAWGTSIGSTRLMHFLGGTDQNIFAKFNSRTPFDTTYRYEFMTFITNLRGLPLNCRNGNTFFVLNNEWRFPFLNVLLRRPLASNMLNNLQIVTFFDLGSAYVGLNPFSEKNTYRNEYVVQKPFTIEIKNFRFPIVAGFGSGLRTMIWGYFIRFDMAWGWDNFQFTKPAYLFSLGTDF
ncbi:MAG: hypothetical protein N2Z72_02175 [Bacteroidales bacterium]|nr:hypothetical protein [Bacteroidales bacterium]